MAEGYAIALGMFDGVHLGHQAVLKNATNSDLKSVAITFSSLPFKTGGWLMTKEQKEIELKNQGIDEVMFLDFCEVCEMEPDEFMAYIEEKYNVKKICCGFNYRFGRRAEGDTAFLQKYCEERNIEFSLCDKISYGGKTVSSSYIRSLISDGKISRATALLSRPFSFKAKVSHGDQRGRAIGFPTTNQVYPEGLATPKFGVYKTKVLIDGKEYLGITNIGLRPTFRNDFVSAETFIKDFSSDCYGKEIELFLLEFIRPERKFDSVEELKAAISDDLSKI
ncbi:MAG: bifunctional riboflavin kinase/FAD synthetase [Clostridia bacterium]|nr:bifunctional riboflavin kinase/FAD synthetase [Clostridia bacterium]